MQPHAGRCLPGVVIFLLHQKLLDLHQCIIYVIYKCTAITCIYGTINVFPGEFETLFVTFYLHLYTRHFYVLCYK